LSFAETYPNISPEIAKHAVAALQDLGDQRIAIMDQNQIDFAVLSLAGPGVQVEKEACFAFVSLFSIVVAVQSYRRGREDERFFLNSSTFGSMVGPICPCLG
jgi:hypothetical protein